MLNVDDIIMFQEYEIGMCWMILRRILVYFLRGKAGEKRGFELENWILDRGSSYCPFLSSTR